MRVKKPSLHIVDGLRTISRLAEADAYADEDRYPQTHPIWKALQWLDEVITEGMT